jgi:hypothetical protein
VRERVYVDLARPRARSVITSPQFADLKAQCLRILEQ